MAVVREYGRELHTYNWAYNCTNTFKGFFQECLLLCISSHGLKEKFGIIRFNQWSKTTVIQAVFKSNTCINLNISTKCFHGNALVLHESFYSKSFDNQLKYNHLKEYNWSFKPCETNTNPKTVTNHIKLSNLFQPFMHYW